MMTNTKTNTTTFTLCVRGFEGATPTARFTFTAQNQEEANRKASKWARYQGFSFYLDAVNASRSDVVVREANGMELGWTPNNEYVS
jgi:hypothetical protein